MALEFRGLEFRGLAVCEPDSGMIRFTGYVQGRESESLVTCHVTQKALAALDHAGDADVPSAQSRMMRIFERHRRVIEATAAAKFRAGENSPVVQARDLLAAPSRRSGIVKYMISLGKTWSGRTDSNRRP